MKPNASKELWWPVYYKKTNGWVNAYYLAPCGIGRSVVTCPLAARAQQASKRPTVAFFFFNAPPAMRDDLSFEIAGQIIVLEQDAFVAHRTPPRASRQPSPILCL